MTMTYQQIQDSLQDVRARRVEAFAFLELAEGAEWVRQANTLSTTYMLEAEAWDQIQRVPELDPESPEGLILIGATAIARIEALRAAGSWSHMARTRALSNETVLR